VRARSGWRHIVPGGGALSFTRNCARLAGNCRNVSRAHPIDWLRAESMTCPSASLIAGAMSCAQGSEPYFFQASYMPATLPGTPGARCPTRLFSVTLPAESTYMLRDAPLGAISR